MGKCSVCKVARYCSRVHSIQAWKKGRLCHKVMCPWLKRWRKIAEGKSSTTELCDELCNDFFERVLASKPKCRIQSDNAEATKRENEISDCDIVCSDNTHDDSKSSAALDLSGVAKHDKREVEVALQLN